MDPLHASTLRTLCLFGAQDQAATLLEVHQLLVRTDPGQRAPALSQLQRILETDLAGSVVSHRGLYALVAARKAIDERVAKYAQTMRLLRRAARFASGLRQLPFVRAGAVSGSSAQMNAREQSDIDLFVIAAPGRIFLARLFVSAYFQVLGMRRHGNAIAGRFCLNHYVAAGMRLPSDHTVYTAMLYTSLLPVFGAAAVESFWQANRDWIETFFIGPQLPVSEAFPPASSGPSLAQRCFEFLLAPVAGLAESLARRLQVGRIHQSEFVVVSDRELAFHPDSKGQRILAKYKGLLTAAGL